MSTSPPPAIELRSINKHFGPVHANKHVSLAVPRGVIHGIIGENGAGKSTLMSILYGFYQADSGEILVDGRPRRIGSSREPFLRALQLLQIIVKPRQTLAILADVLVQGSGIRDALEAGIGMVHQHFMLVDTFTVLENVMLGAEGGRLLAASRAAAEAELRRLTREFGLDVAVDAVVGDLPVGVRQRVEILKALYRGARILILDEPTGVLTPQETERLFRILAALRAEGVTVILITHKLREIMAITDSVSVMRGGEMVAHRRTAETSQEELAELMVGRKVLLRVDKGLARPGEVVLEVSDLQVVDAQGVARLDGVTFSVRAGEIVGVAGVSGNGQSELLEALAGIRRLDRGRVVVAGVPIMPDAPRDARAMRQLGVAHVPEDRLRMGLVPAFVARESFILGYHEDPAYNRRVLTNVSATVADCRTKMDRYDVRPGSPHLRTASFSGGNQQKLVLARDLERAPKLLLVGQPTRGVDIGAIEFIHKSLIAMRDAGCGVLLVSVELEEVMSLSDRILVMFGGRIVGEVPADRADERTLGLMMANIVPEAETDPVRPAG